MLITWKRLKDASPKLFRKGSALYELSEEWDVKVGGFLTGTRFVIVGVTEAACDHGLSETQCFAANKRGGFFSNLDHESAAYDYSRVVGRIDHEESLRRLTRQSYITKEEQCIQREAEEAEECEPALPWDAGPLFLSRLRKKG